MADEKVETAEASEDAPARGPVRSCIGCGARIPVRAPDAADLVRLVLGPGGEIAVDAAGGAAGRGAHLHARPACLDRAPRGLGRAFKGAARAIGGEPLSPGGLARAIGGAYERRAASLLVSAARSRKLALGADAVTEALRAGEGALVVVASDAAAAADLSEVRRAIAAGRAVSFGDKSSLARLLRPGRAEHGGEVGVAAILDAGIAEALRAAVAIVGAAQGAASSSRPGGQGRGRPGTSKANEVSDRGLAKAPGPGGAERAGALASDEADEASVDSVPAAANSGDPPGRGEAGGRASERRRGGAPASRRARARA